MPHRRLTGPSPVLAIVAGTALVGALVGGFTDLYVYRFAGRSVLDGTSLAGTRDPVMGLPFTYPPFAAVLMVPLALAPAWVAAGLISGASMAALAVVVRLARRELGRPAPGWLVAVLALGAVALEPVWQNLSFGQVNLLLMVAVLVDVLRPDRRGSGLLLGVAVGVKLTPVVFVLLMVLVGRRAMAGRALACFAATVGLGFLVAPGSSTSYWGDRLVDASRVGPPALAHNQSVYGALTRLLDREPPMLLWLALAGTLALVAVGLGAWWWRRGERLLGTCLTALGMLVASPVAWSHHWVWAVPLVLAVWAHTRLLAAVVAAVFVARPFVWLPWGDGAEYGWSWWQHLVGDAYLWCSLGVVVWAVRAARRGDATRDPTYAAEVARQRILPDRLSVSRRSR
jgi:alpha-1,2-mannosyltransferase